MDVNALRGVVAEMRGRRVNHGRDESATLSAWADRIEAALPPPLGPHNKRWPFVESPGEFTARLEAAMREFPLLGAVRNVLIENPPQLVAPEAGDPPLEYNGDHEDFEAVHNHQELAFRLDRRPLVIDEATIHRIAKHYMSKRQQGYFMAAVRAVIAGRTK